MFKFLLVFSIPLLFAYVMLYVFGMNNIGFLIAFLLAFIPEIYFSHIDKRNK